MLSVGAVHWAETGYGPSDALDSMRSSPKVKAVSWFAFRVITKAVPHEPSDDTDPPDGRQIDPSRRVSSVTPVVWAVASGPKARPVVSTRVART